jgi:ribosome-binding factor A
MKPFARSDRVGGQIQKALSDILLKKIKDPRLESATITGVKMSRDLKFAKVYFVTPGGKESINEAVEGFKSAFGYVKRKLAAQLGLRYMPELRFFYDDSFDYGSHMDKVIKAVKSENGYDNTTIQ